MNAYLLSQLPLALAFAVLLLMGGYKGAAQEALSNLVCIVGIALTAILMWLKLEPGMTFFGEAIRITSFGRVIAYLGLALSLVGIILSEDYLPRLRINGVDWRMVVLTLCIGIVHLGIAGDLATLFIAFELISIPAYILAGFNHHDRRANEAGMKYLLLGIFASALFLLGISFIYGATGAIHFTAINERLALAMEAGRSADIVFAKIALGLIMAALFFKVAAAPFHNWLADVYQGTNYASLIFIASPSKVALFGLMALLLWGPFQPLYEAWKPVLLTVAACCAVFGNIQAISQTNVKRLLAYSAVANAGFILLAIVAGARDTIALYLSAYGLTTLGGLAALMGLGTSTADVDEISDLQGLGKSNPGVATLFTVVLMSYAGIPLTAGFAAKFGVALEFLRPASLMGSPAIAVMVLAVVASLISFFYYFRIVRAIWMKSESGVDAPIFARELGWGSRFVLFLCAMAIVALGLVMRVPGA